jgi:GGDEF domain-containing protein
MASDFPIQGILDHLVRRIVDILPITGAGVTLIPSTTSSHDVAASDEAALLFEKLQTEMGEGPCLSAYRSGKAVAVPDLRGQHPYTAFGPAALAAGLAAVFTFPLRHNAGQLGALDLYRNTPGPLSPGDMEAAPTLADVTVAYLANARARSELQDASEQFHSSSLHDALTGLPNRLLLLERLEHALLRSVRSRHPVALLFVDLDRFKLVNDSHGHMIGDELLVAVDEFVIVCEAITKKLQIHLIARRIVEALGAPFPLDDVVVEVSASVGIAFSTPNGADPEELLREADIAMYQAKRRGGGTHQVVDVQEQGLAERLVALQRDLGLAVERGELRNEYQPIVRISDGRILGAEALLRWDHPSFGLVPPTTMIPLAEQSGVINDIGRWVLERACPDLRRWSQGERGPDGLPFTFGMAVNVSAHQLLAPDFVATVADVLDSTGTPPPRPHARDHRERLHPRPQAGPGRAVGPQGARGAHRPRRFRHRLFVAQLPQAFPGRQRQDRSDLHGGPGPRLRQPCHRLQDDRAGPSARSLGRDRRGGDGRPARRGAAHGQRVLPGLLLRPAHVGRKPR